MQLPQSPCRLCADVADAVVGAESLRSAYDAILTTLIPQLSQGMFFVKRGQTWLRVAGQVQPDVERIWIAQLDRVSTQHRSVTVLVDEGHATITVLPIATGNAAPTLLVFDGDWTASQDVLVSVAIVTGFALRSFHKSRLDLRPAALLRGTTGLVRGIRTAQSIEASMRLIASHAASMLNAERVSVWIPSTEDNSLRAAATRGIETSVLADVRIIPGEWVIGHVYQSGRAIFVDDVRDLPRQDGRSRYRTNAFACVPLKEHGITRGVLSITDKRDGVPFDKTERIALRTLGCFVGTVLAAAEAAAEIGRLSHAASVDVVTGLLNRSSLESRLLQEVSRTNREQGQLAVLMADLDDFKHVNDKYGHQSGDALLSLVGSIIRSSVRTFDICARYGGDEFVVVMPNTDEASAVACAERIRDRISQARDHGQNVVGMSIGLTTSIPNEDPVSLIRRADQALYHAKFSGKNVVRVNRGGSVIDSSPQGQPVSPAAASSTADLRLSYALIADQDADRGVVYQQLCARFRLGLLVARNRDQAAAIIGQFGPPVLLVIDLTLTVIDGLAIVDSLPLDGHATTVVAISQSRQLREYAIAKTTGVRFEVVNPRATADVVSARIESALQQSDAAVVALQPSVSKAAASEVAAANSSEPLWEPELIERERAESALARELSRVRREQRQLSIVLFDISADGRVDSFSSATLADSTLLDSVIDTLINAIRPTDVPIRWGRSEFLLVLPGLAGGSAKIVAERIRAAMHARGSDRVAVAGGVAELEQHEQFGDVVARAREQLGVAHGLGHNRISFSPVH